jgi:uncharacterized membrane protein
MAIAGFGGTTPNEELTHRAREALRGKWGLSIAAFVVYLLISSALSGVYPKASGLISLIITGPFTLGLSMFFLEIVRGATPPFSRVFEGFQRFPTAMGAYVLMVVFIVLWSLLLIVPGIIAALSYSMTWYILVDDDRVGPMEAIRRSKEMMDGHKGRLFLLLLRFFGWALLCILTLGIGFLWLVPYINASMAAFYEDLRPADSGNAISRWL